jgi:hypothetical protein
VLLWNVARSCDLVLSEGVARSRSWCSPIGWLALTIWLLSALTARSGTMALSELMARFAGVVLSFQVARYSSMRLSSALARSGSSALSLLVGSLRTLVRSLALVRSYHGVLSVTSGSLDTTGASSTLWLTLRVSGALSTDGSFKFLGTLRPV